MVEKGNAMIRSRIVSGIIWAVMVMAVQVWPAVAGPEHGQRWSRKDDIVFNSRGVPLAGATVRVCAMPSTGQPCAPLALIYSDAGLTQALANPTTTDGMGNYTFYAAPGKYEVEISGPGITTKQLPNVILPSDPAAPTFSSISSTGGISAFSLSLTGNLTVNGSTQVVGSSGSGTLNLSNESGARSGWSRNGESVHEDDGQTALLQGRDWNGDWADCLGERGANEYREYVHGAAKRGRRSSHQGAEPGL